MRLWQLVRTESRSLAVWVRDPRLWLVVVFMLLAGAVAYAQPFHYTLHIGGAAEQGNFARPYLVAGFNRDRERSESGISRTFRWVFGDANIILPDIGTASHAVTLHVVAGQPSTPVPSGWSNGDSPLLAVPLRSDTRQYHALVPGGRGDLDLRITTPTFTAPNDPRALAFAADALRIASLGASIPPIGVGWLVLSVAISYGLLRRWNVPPNWAFVACAMLVCSFGLLLAYRRLGLTTFAPRLGVLLGAAYMGTILLIPLLLAWSRLLGVVATTAEVRGIAALVMLAWIIRLGGLLHPQAYTNDLTLHANNLRGVVRGQIIFTENLPGEAGGGPAPYPPAQYVMLLPLAGFADAGLVLQTGTTLVDSLMIMWGWLLLRAAGGTAGAAFWAGGLYLFALPLLRSLLVGEVANVWGQALLGPMALAVWHWETLRPPVLSGVGFLRYAAVPVVCVVLALLGHFGVFLSLLILFAVYVVLLMVLRGPWLGSALLIAVSVGISVVLYYSAHFGIIVASPDRAAVPFGFARLGGELRKAFDAEGLLGPLVPLLGLAGLALIVRRLPRLRALMLAWWVSTLLSLGSLLWTQQALRWTAFLFPALAWSGGIALQTLAARGRAGRALAYAAITVVVIWGAVLWYSQIASYNH